MEIELIELEFVIKEQVKSHPLIMPRDVIKLVYQNEFGSGHFVDNPEKSLLRLREEAEGILYDENIPPKEYVGNGIYRININSKENEKISLEELNEKFVYLACTVKGSRDEFIKKLEFIKNNFSHFDFCFSLEEFQSYIEEYIKSGCSPVSHSEEYRKAYSPKYRIVSEK